MQSILWRSAQGDSRIACRNTKPILVFGSVLEILFLVISKFADDIETKKKEEDEKQTSYSSSKTTWRQKKNTKNNTMYTHYFLFWCCWIYLWHLKLFIFLRFWNFLRRRWRGSEIQKSQKTKIQKKIRGQKKIEQHQNKK